MRRFYHNTRFSGEERVPIRKHEEQTLQEWFTFWLNSLRPRVLSCASTQGMKLSRGVAIKLKKMGYRAGYPDYPILEPRGGYHGMFVELKVKSKPTEEQIEWQKELTKRGYYAVIVPGNLSFTEAQKFLEEETRSYLAGEKQLLICAY